MKINRQTIQSLLVITVTLTIAGAAMTQSLYRDMQQSDKSQFAMGTLDLVLSDENRSTTHPIEIGNVGEQNSLIGTKKLVVRNNGSLPGRLTVDIDNIVNQENGCNEPESLVDASCGNPGDGQGELGGATVIQLSMKDGDTIKPLIVANLGPTGQAAFREQWQALTDKITIPAGEARDFILSWEIKGGDNSNQLQSDSVVFDLVFTLNQIIN